MRTFAPLLFLAFATAPAAADEPPRLVQAMGVDLRTLEPAPGQDGRALSLFARASYPVAPHTRGGLEVGAGWAQLRTPAPKAAMLRLRDDGGLYYAAMLFGVSFDAGPVSGGSEVAAGARAVDGAAAMMLEPRLKVEIRLRSDVTFGVRAGSDLAHRADLVGGAYVTVETRR